MLNYTMDTDKSPVRMIDTSFENYVKRRKRETGIHMNGTVPDYAFDLDCELRARLDRIPHFYGLCRKITSTIVNREMQKINQKALLAGPDQFPEIYQMGIDCAHRLGIGIPNIYIESSPEMNAYTYASDDTSPLLVLYTGIVDRMTPGELKAVIGHECGHIHNQHLVYRNVIQELLTGASGLMGSIVLSGVNISLMQFWTRAAEITADRAGIICADNLQDAVNVEAKLASGGTINSSYRKTMDLEAVYEQLSMTMDNPTRLLEIERDHPAFARRVACDLEFGRCEVLFSWRPDLKKPGIKVNTKAETDAKCKKYVNILRNQ